MGKLNNDLGISIKISLWLDLNYRFLESYETALPTVLMPYFCVQLIDTFNNTGILQEINVKNFRKVCGAKIWTHYLWVRFESPPKNALDHVSRRNLQIEPL